MVFWQFAASPDRYDKPTDVDARQSSSGIEPVNELNSIFNVCMLVNVSKDVGTGPVIPRLLKLKAEIEFPSQVTRRHEQWLVFPNHPSLSVQVVPPLL